VRRRPHSVVLLDEIEKAHPDVHEMFFQVFDKGWMEDGEGRYIDFRNTVILLTSNVGAGLISERCGDPERWPEPDALARAVRQPLRDVFPAALLGRLNVVPYYPLSDAMLEQIIRLQLQRIQRRVLERHGAEFHHDAAVVALIRSRCTEVESGARMVDALLTQNLLPRMARHFLLAAGGDQPVQRLDLGVENDDFTLDCLHGQGLAGSSSRH
jgi:type VI secretion system protein VasG